MVSLPREQVQAEWKQPVDVPPVGPPRQQPARKASRQGGGTRRRRGMAIYQPRPADSEFSRSPPWWRGRRRNEIGKQCTAEPEAKEVRGR